MTAAGERAYIPFGELMALPQLEAKLRVPERMTDDLAQAPVVSVPVVDLANPRPHLIGSELLLITGLGLVDDDEWMLGYATAVKDAGTVALGFGVEPVFSAVPASLERACRAVGLPLVEFPPHLPFVHVTTAFFTAMEQDRLQRLDRLNRLALSLMHASLSRNPEGDAVRALARYLGGAVLFERGETRIVEGILPFGLAPEPVLAEAPPVPPGMSGHHHGTPEAGGRSDRYRAERASREFRSSDGHHHLIELATAPVRSGRTRLPVGARLSVASPRPLHGTDLTAIHLTVDALQLIHGTVAASSAAVDSLLMELVLDALTRGDRAARARTAKRLLSALAGGHQRTRPETVIGCVGRRRTGDPAQAQDLAWWRTELGTAFVDVADQALRAIVAHPPSDTTVAALARAGWSLTLTEPVAPHDLPAALLDATVLSRRSLDDARGLDRAPSPPSARWAGLADATTRAAASRRFLAPLIGESAPDELERCRVLRAWLEHHGAWDATARALDLHRNTVRRQVGEAEALLGVPLSDARVRAELLLALEALGVS